MNTIDLKSAICANWRSVYHQPWILLGRQIRWWRIDAGSRYRICKCNGFVCLWSWLSISQSPFLCFVVIQVVFGSDSGTMCQQHSIWFLKSNIFHFFMVCDYSVFYMSLKFQCCRYRFDESWVCLLCLSKYFDLLFYFVSWYGWI